MDNVTNVIDIANQVGRATAREFPGLEAEDIASQALLDLWEKEDRLTSNEPAYLRAVLEEAAREYAAKERYEYMIGTSSYVYRPVEVRAILQEVYWNPTDWDVPSSKDDHLSATVSKDTIFVSVLDIRAAWERLSRNHTDTLTRVFRDGQEPDYRMDVTRAVDALTRHLNWRVNRPSDFEGRRTVSNGEAQYMAGNEW